MVTDSGDIILMDLGVLKLIGAKSFSDEEEKAFVGTLRYAPPEFLTRIEKDTVDGWRAINLYQIGATLHDIIMRKELFIDKTPYTNLVIAIKDDNPVISNNEYPFELLQLTRDMLGKDWQKRIKLIENGRIDKIIKSNSQPKNSLDDGIEEILKMRVGHQASFDEIEKMQRTKSELLEKRKEFANRLYQVLQDCVFEIKDKGVCNDTTASKRFNFSNDRKNDKIIQNVLFELVGDLKIGYPSNLYLFFRITNSDNNYTTIEAISVFPSIGQKPDMNNPINFFRQLDPTSRQVQNLINRVGKPQINFGFKTINLFDGIAEIDDSLKNHLKKKIVELIAKSLKSVEKRVTDEIEFKKESANSNKRVSFRVSSGSQTVIINRL